MTMVSACLNVDPVKRPGTEQLSKFSLFTHDNFNIWFVQELQEKLNEEFSSNPLLKTRKSLPSPSMIKGATVDIPSKRSSEKVLVVRNVNARISKVLFVNKYFMLQETKPRGLKGLDNDLLFDEVMKKSLVYSQKYNANLTKQTGQNKNQLIIADKRHNSSAKSDLSVYKFYDKKFEQIISSSDNTDWYFGR